jgi:uncharacterized membrane protein YraQ (UPF0718 family)
MQVRAATAPIHSRREVVFSIILLLVIVGGLIVYKTNGGFVRLQQVSSTGALPINATALFPQQAATEQGVLARSIAYLQIIGPAFIFGVLIAAAVRTFVSPAWIARVLSHGSVRQHVAAGISGAPLMLCSCCVAPVFTAVYERSARLGPSLAMALAAPSLNPIALALTFMLFHPSIAIARLAMALAVVFLVAPAIGRVAGHVGRLPRSRAKRASASLAGTFGGGGKPVTEDAVPTTEGAAPTTEGAARTLEDEDSASAPSVRSFLASCGYVAVRTVPLLIGGTLISMWLAGSVPVATAGAGALGLAAAVAVASLIAMPLAMPTFFEIPLALTLVAAGAPAGAVAAVLFAGPAINLPSLLTIARVTTWKVAALVAASVAIVACGGGLALSAAGGLP